MSFCTTIRHRQWEACIHFFAPQHLAFQHKIYFSPDYNESPPDPDDPTERARFRDWYLRHTLGLSYVDNHLRTIDQVRRIEVMDLNRPHGPEGPLKAVLAVSTRPGQRDGWFYVDPVSLHFFGSYG